jgi:hypothetical protein
MARSSVDFTDGGDALALERRRAWTARADDMDFTDAFGSCHRSAGSDAGTIGWQGRVDFTDAWPLCGWSPWKRGLSMARSSVDFTDGGDALALERRRAWTARADDMDFTDAFGSCH